MVIDKWKLEAAVRLKPGLSITELAEILMVDKRTALRHARRHGQLLVERGHRRRGRVTRVWLKWDPPRHLSPSANRGLQFEELDEL